MVYRIMCQINMQTFPCSVIVGLFNSKSWTPQKAVGVLNKKRTGNRILEIITYEPQEWRIKRYNIIQILVYMQKFWFICKKLDLLLSSVVNTVNVSRRSFLTLDTSWTVKDLHICRSPSSPLCLNRYKSGILMKN